MKTSKLSLKFVNNIKRQIMQLEDKAIKIISHENSKHLKFTSGERSINFRNCYEFYIDDQPLINIISNCYWDHEANEESQFFNSHIGCLGGFGFFWDQIYVSILTNKEFSQNQIEKLFELFKRNFKYSDDPMSIQKVCDKIVSNIRDQFLMYCCQDCGDSGCGGLTLNIKREGNMIVWTDNEKIKIQFNKIEYEEVFQDFLKKRELNYLA
jgi:hypothetical protein